jgi:hypothetical protein
VGIVSEDSFLRFPPVDFAEIVHVIG